MYFASIGFEVHIELKTASKMFCGCAADYFGKEPNTQTCQVCLGLPAALPVPNKKAIEWTILLGIALNCKINLESRFDRKNYFYADLSKGYQISQFEKPFATGGWLKFTLDHSRAGGNPDSAGKLSLDPRLRGDDHGEGKNNNGLIRINRVHLEEDTAKLTHAVTSDGDVSLIDFNRSGVPLVEIVTEPDFHDVSGVKEYLKAIQRIVRYLGISDADMEKGTMRCEPSISLSTDPKKLASYRVEIKNINSFKFAERAISYEIDRQAKLLDQGITPEQETRGWDENKNLTVLQRSKENAEDYRYFPEPDIPPFVITEEFIDNIKKQLPELPDVKCARYVKEFGLSEYEAQILTDDIQTAKNYEKILTNTNQNKKQGNTETQNKKGDTKNRICVDPLEIRENPILAKEIAKLIINKKIDINSKSVIDDVAKLLQPVQSTVSDIEIEKVVKKVIEANEKAVADYKSGKTQVLGFLTGLCMKELKGKCGVTEAQKTIVSLLH